MMSFMFGQMTITFVAEAFLFVCSLLLSNTTNATKSTNTTNLTTFFRLLSVFGIK